MKCALIYDFDGTLAEGNCAEHGLLPSLGFNDTNKFWELVKERAKNDDGDEILSYLGILASKAVELNSNELSKERLTAHGNKIPLFPGVAEWFDRIDTYADSHGIEIQHYIISSGLEAMIKGTTIGSKFKEIYACKFHYSSAENPFIWPAQSINYTTKTQFLFRINKGINNSWDNEAINKFIEPELRDIPFSRMIYFGDGDTDIPSMKMVRNQGGYSLAVFNKGKWENTTTQNKIEKLIAEERADYVVPADYSEYSQLDITVKGLLQLFKRKYLKDRYLS